MLCYVLIFEINLW